MIVYIGKYGQISTDLAILYPINPSKDGRDIYYDKSVKPYPGSGVFPLISDSSKIATGEQKVSDYVNTTAYIVGSFEKWEDIPDTLDRYLILKSGTYKNAGMDIPKIRVGFSNYINSNHHISVLGVEDVTVLKNLDSLTQKNNITTETFKLGAFSGYIDRIGSIIQKGDVLVVTLSKDVYKGIQSNPNVLIDKKDINQNKIAAWVFIRRIDPKKELQQEVLVKDIKP